MTNTRTGQQFVDVAPAIPLPAHASQLYTYAVPTGQPVPEVFTRVTIPFGKRSVVGVVVRERGKPGRFTAKELQPYSPIQLTSHQVAFGQWIAHTMQGGLGFTLRLLYPPAKKLSAADVAQSLQSSELALAITASDMLAAPLAIIEADSATRLAVVRAQLQEAPPGSQALVVVPERWMIDRVLRAVPAEEREGWLGVDAKLTGAGLTRAWAAVQRGEVRAVVGTQKALFLPYQRLGTIVVEEEFYPTHKLWDQYPRLHNVPAAQALAHIHGARMIYAGSFMSLRLAYAVSQKKVKVMAVRPVVPRPEVLSYTPGDIQKHYPLPQELSLRLQRWLRHHERVFILHNARGTWQAVTCQKCKHVLRCKECGVAYTLHESAEKKEQLQCHHCGTTASLLPKCPHCKSGTLRGFGMGTERVGTAVRALAPDAAFVRLDADTLQGDTLPPALERTHTQGLLILGTVKALRVLHGYPLHRVVYLFPERGILYPDFRSEERTYTLLVRLQQLLSHRTKVVIVTRRKQLLESTLALPPEKFMARQLRERARLQYPPYRDMVVAIVRGKTVDAALSKAGLIREQLEERIAASPAAAAITLRGPFRPFVIRTRGLYEARLLLLGPLEVLTGLYEHMPIDVIDVYPERIL